MDIVTRERRSEIMRGIRGNELKPEATMHKALRAKGLRPGRNPKGVFGKPDFWWPRKRVAVFVDGCFWHGCPWHWKLPRSNQAFWAAKIQVNVTRDERTTQVLEHNGFTVVRVWECSLLKSPSWWAGWVAQAVAGVPEASLVLKMAWKRPEIDQKRLENSLLGASGQGQGSAEGTAGGQNVPLKVVSGLERAEGGAR